MKDTKKGTIRTISPEIKEREDHLIYELSNRITELRLASNMTQQQVADAMHMKRMLYNQIEQGTRNGILYIDVLAEVFGPVVFQVGVPGLFDDFDVRLYSNHKLAIYMQMFGIGEREVMRAFQIDLRQLRLLISKDERVYLPQFRPEFDCLFSEIGRYKGFPELAVVGNNSIAGEVEGKRVYLLNCRGKYTVDSFFDIAKD